MKRVFFLIVLIILYCFIVHEKTESTFLEKIDLNLEENEIGVVIYNNDILLKQNGKNTLILVDEDDNVNQFLATFEVDKINNLITYIDDTIVDAEIIKKEENDFKIKLNNYTFCIYEQESIDTCSFVYLKNENSDIEINNQNKAIFYKGKGELQENLYIKWIDSYSLSSNEYIIIKIKDDTYNIINIPIQ